MQRIVFGAAIILVVLATGISAFNPARATTPPQELCAKLTAVITQRGDIWQAVFEGDCGRPYKYSIAMEGRLAGGSVMFKGTADLGAQDGGVYDWIGRADNNEFVGFFTSAAYTGLFNMTRTVKSWSPAWTASATRSEAPDLMPNNLSRPAPLEEPL